MGLSIAGNADQRVDVGFRRELYNVAADRRGGAVHDKGNGISGGEPGLRETQACEEADCCSEAGERNCSALYETKSALHSNGSTRFCSYLGS